MRFKRKNEIIYIVIAILVLTLYPMSAIADSSDASDSSIAEDLSNAVDVVEDLYNNVSEKLDVSENGDEVIDEPEPEPETTVEAINVKVVCDGRSRMKVSWTCVSEGLGYDVYRSTKSSMRGIKVFSTSKPKVTKFTDEKAPIDLKYYYTVKPRKPIDAEEDEFLWKAGKSDGVKNILIYKKCYKVKAYAYTGSGHTASGKKAQVGRIAVDPRYIKIGTWIYIEGYGLAQACDTGGNIKGNTIDVYLKSLQACRQWGIRYPKIYILK